MEAWIVENELVLTFVLNSLIAIGTLAAEVVLMTFSDAAGRCWERDAHGVLVRRADLDAVHRRVTGP